MTGGQLTVQDADSLDRTTVVVQAHLGTDRFEELVVRDRRGARAEDAPGVAGQEPNGWSRP